MFHRYGFKQDDTAGCILVLHESSDLIITAIFVDNFVGVYSFRIDFGDYLKYVNTHLMDSGAVSRCNGLEITYDGDEGEKHSTDWIHQYDYRQVDSASCTLMRSITISASYA